MKIPALLLTDGYKMAHYRMYPEKTTLVYSNFTPRSVKYMPEEAKDIVVFGIQYTIMYINDHFNNEFFNKPKEEVIPQIKKYLSSYIGSDYDVTHFEQLHNLGYLPLEIKGLEEGTVVGEKIPILTYKNTKPEFYWVVNFFETLISTTLWKPMHSASIAYGMKKVLKKYCLATDENNVGFLDFQGHDFSFRGMQGTESALQSGLGFLTSFKGSDTLPVLWGGEYYYGTSDSAFSVPASEHAIASSYGKETEVEGFERILDLYPTGIVSMVSDTYDFWKIHTDTIYKLKDRILAREGKAVFRGDSGDPADIICGTEKEFGKGITPQKKGQIELLWDCFGGTINSQGYKILNPKCGAIWGDGCTFSRITDICERLKAKGFASTNIVFGIGSYTMGYATRDNQGTACKATYIEVNGEGREIFKDPITDDGTKKSKKGMLSVHEIDGKLIVKDQQSWGDENTGLLKTVFSDGTLTRTTTLSEIRTRLA